MLHADRTGKGKAPNLGPNIRGDDALPNSQTYQRPRTVRLTNAVSPVSNNGFTFTPFIFTLV
jgi:hypothetical protein